MSVISLSILISVVVLGTIGQLSLKYALHISSYRKKASISIQDIVLSRYFWIWFTSYVVMTVLWLTVLRTIPLNQAFPFLGLTYALVPLASQRFLNEKVVLSQWLGIAVIIAGVLLVVQKSIV